MQQGSPIQTFIGHGASVMSVDFHPKKEDLVCSCDGDSAIRYWSVKNGVCTGVLKVQLTKQGFSFSLASSTSLYMLFFGVLLACSISLGAPPREMCG